MRRASVEEFRDQCIVRELEPICAHFRMVSHQG
jgi:hypothetical protein